MFSNKGSTLVTFLNYDPYASFAPTYDSSGATLSYADSALYISSQSALAKYRELRKLPQSERLVESSSSVASTSKALIASGSEIEAEPNLPADLGFTLEDLQKDLTTLPLEAGPILARSAQKLRSLQLAQWQRLGRAVKTSTKQLPKPTTNELREASEALGILSALIPSTGTQLLPATATLHEQMLELNKGSTRPFYGSLERTNDKAVKESVLQTAPPAAHNRLLHGTHGSHSHDTRTKQVNVPQPIVPLLPQVTPR